MLKNIETARSECTAKKKENMASSSTVNLVDFFCSNLLEDKDLQTEIACSIDVFTRQVGSYDSISIGSDNLGRLSLTYIASIQCAPLALIVGGSAV